MYFSKVGGGRGLCCYERALSEANKALFLCIECSSSPSDCILLLYRFSLDMQTAPESIEDESVVLEIVWEDRSILIKSILLNRQQSLLHIDHQLRIACPELVDVEFCYVLNGKPIFEEFWDVFKVKNLLPVLSLRPGTVELVKVHG